MPGRLAKTGERIIPEHFLYSKEAYLVYLRHLFSYEFIKESVSEQSCVLEVGCGEGYGTSRLSSVVKHIIGVDVDERVIEYASKKYGSENCSFKLSNGVTLPFDTNMFDVVVSLEVIEHIQDDIKFLTEIRRVVKAKGTYILTTPNKTYRIRPHKKPWNRFHVREYSPDELENTLKTIFSDVRVWGICGSAEIQNIEQARVKQAQKFANLIPLNLRRLIPVSLETWMITLLKTLLKKPHSSQNTRDFLEAYTIHDYHLVKEHVEESLDLLAICKP